MHLPTLDEFDSTDILLREALSFGDTPANNNPEALGVFTYNLRFPGQVFDGHAGLHQNYFRDYSPAVGRYVESDPIGLLAGTNPYSYVKAQPTHRIDPQGLIDWNGYGTTVAAVGGVGATVTFFTLESECKCGKRITARVTAVGPAAGFGLKATAGFSKVAFSDPWPCPDAGALDGLYLSIAAGLTVGAIPNPNNPRFGRGLPGIGGSVNYTQMGDAISIGWPPGITVGRDQSVSATLGSATVTQARINDCGCER